MSICFHCIHFKQYSPLSFTTSGQCDWDSGKKFPAWLENYLATNDYYGPKRESGIGVYAVKQCHTFEKASDEVVDKRFSENWYE